eukprot:snap_masked-scaffold_121-processed-gene-0.3-mRNA-1 protein AED:1.00 eAED:1.00 QI:0/0/0/0/1/1/2/0/539
MNQIRKVSWISLVKRSVLLYATLRTLFSVQRRISKVEGRTNIAYMRGVGVNPLGIIPSFFPARSQVYDFKIGLFEQHSKALNKKVDAVVVVPHPFYPEEIIFSRSAEITRYITKDNFNNWVKSDLLLQNLEPLLGQGIFCVNHGLASQSLASLNISDLWTFQRKTASKIFTKNIFKNHVLLTLKKNTKKVIENIENSTHVGEYLSMKTEFYNFTLDSIGDIGFGVDLNTLQSTKYSRFSKAFDEVIPNISKRNIWPWWKFPVIKHFIPSEVIVKNSVKELNIFCNEIIVDRLSLLKNSGTEKALDGKGDILSLFVKSLISKGIDVRSSAAKKFLRDVIMSFKIAGRDTTACTLTFLFHLISLSENEHIQETLVKEIISISTLSYENILNQDLKYLDGVINETLRLFPPVPVDGKENVNADILPNGVRVKPGTKITFEIFAMGRDETRYEDPLKVKPERWFDSSIPEEAFPVFQGGPRVCLGKDLARLEIKFLVISLLQKYKFSYDKNEEALIKAKPVVYTPGITLGFNGPLKLNITSRK